MRIGVIAPSEIAIRRFMPALAELPSMEFAGVAVHSADEWFGTLSPQADEAADAAIAGSRRRARVFVDGYGGSIYGSYASLLEDESVDAVYVPLPPALHAHWGARAIAMGKHVLMEKPFTTSALETSELIAAASDRGLALHENYMFAYHAQLDEIDRIVSSGEIGDIRLTRITFGFPRRSQNDFRYDPGLGGGALLDAGGYTLRYAAALLGPTAALTTATSNSVKDVDVDMFGSATLVNDDGMTVQVAFGMDNSYRCDLDVWGSTGSLRTGRVLTAPAGFVPTVTVTTADGDETRELPADDAFRKSLEQFERYVADPAAREERYREIQAQADLVEQFRAAVGARS